MTLSEDSEAIISSCDSEFYSLPAPVIYCMYYVGRKSVKLLKLVGSGAYGQVFKAAWRGTIVAAKVVSTVGSATATVIDNELNVYK